DPHRGLLPRHRADDGRDRERPHRQRDRRAGVYTAAPRCRRRGARGTGVSTVVLVGTLDTKGAEIDFVRGRLSELGADVLVIDAGVMDQSSWHADVGADEVAAAAGANRRELAAAGDRSAAMAVMRAGVLSVVTALH